MSQSAPIKLIAIFIFFLALCEASFASNRTALIYVNGIQNTIEDAKRTTNRIDEILEKSPNHQGASKRTFFVVYVWNPIGWFGSKNGPDLEQDKMELFLLKTAEENYASDFRKIMAPHNASAVVDVGAAIKVKSYLDRIAQGATSLERMGKITATDMEDTRNVALSIVQSVLNIGPAIVVAHSQGNLLANLAYATLASEFGNDTSKKIRVVNIANTSQFSVNNLSFTHAGDAALFSAATKAIAPTGDQSLQTLPGRTGWWRDSLACSGSCDFTIGTASFGAPTTSINRPNTADAVPDRFLDHSILYTYLSTAIVPIANALGVSFSALAEGFADRFEDLIYAAAASLDGPASSYYYSTKFGTAGNGNGQFNSPMGIAIDPISHDIIVADTANSRIQIFSSAGTYRSQFGTPGVEVGRFRYPNAVAIDPVSRNIVVADSGNSRIQIFSAAGVYLNQFGGFGIGSGQFGWPAGVAIDPTNQNIVVTDDDTYDPRNARVQIFNSSGKYLRQFGSFGTGNGQFGGTGGTNGVGIDPTSRNIIVAEGSNSRVQIFSPTGVYLDQFGSRQSGNYNFNSPYGVAVDPVSRNIIVTDLNECYLKIFSSAGVFINQLGECGSGDGQVYFPAGVAVDPTTQAIAVAEIHNNRIQVFARR